MNSSKTENTNGKIPVRRARLDSLFIYEITEDELATLERGSPSSTYLNFAIFFLSVGVSFLVNILTVEMQLSKVFVTFLAIACACMATGTVLFVLWLKERKSISVVIKRIKQRMSSSGVSGESQK